MAKYVWQHMAKAKWSGFRNFSGMDIGRRIRITVSDSCGFNICWAISGSVFISIMYVIYIYIHIYILYIYYMYVIYIYIHRYVVHTFIDVYSII